MKEGSLDVVLLEVPVKGRGKVRDGAERFEAGCRSGRFVIVDAVLLCVSFCDVADLVTDHLAHVVVLPLAD